MPTKSFLTKASLGSLASVLAFNVLVAPIAVFAAASAPAPTADQQAANTQLMQKCLSGYTVQAAAQHPISFQQDVLKADQDGIAKRQKFLTDLAVGGLAGAHAFPGYQYLTQDEVDRFNQDIIADQAILKQDAALATPAADITVLGKVYCGLFFDLRVYSYLQDEISFLNAAESNDSSITSLQKQLAKLQALPRTKQLTFLGGPNSDLTQATTHANSVAAAQSPMLTTLRGLTRFDIDVYQAKNGTKAEFFSVIQQGMNNLKVERQAAYQFTQNAILLNNAVTKVKVPMATLNGGTVIYASKANATLTDAEIASASKQEGAQAKVLLTDRANHNFSVIYTMQNKKWHYMKNLSKVTIPPGTGGVSASSRN